MADRNSGPTLRTDARRNVERIRAAAIEVFRVEGLSAPLENVAGTAQVSKATIFNRFGGRIGLIDSVIDEVVATKLKSVIDDARSVPGISERIRFYVGAIRDLQYRLPAVNDVLLQAFPASGPLMELCHLGGSFHEELVQDGHAANALAEEVTPEDFQAMAVDNSLALKYGVRPSRAAYERRTGLLLDGICQPAHGRSGSPSSW
ncbi:TetR/AcrR family transcriptional regulator [Brevibacterium aurantiacum]|uniref:TetR/AcrR family transcriptional regulator n=1 Tax=Brevibacterium aurantiacum TaxID=273384 RepID=A0A556CDA9_BREAU|nr:TetR family transcriptional regulator [Brevibacterium aurantiacum]TSI15425.1 TetR/AcrR family transcriptional regulator [Brevibacterium aurantiacum]